MASTTASADSKVATSNASGFVLLHPGHAPTLHQASRAESKEVTSAALPASYGDQDAPPSGCAFGETSESPGRAVGRGVRGGVSACWHECVGVVAWAGGYGAGLGRMGGGG